MNMFKIFIIVPYLALLLVHPAETREAVTMRPFVGECSPFSFNCESCVAAQCILWEMDRNFTQGDLCWPPYMNVQQRQFAVRRRTTVEECLGYVGRIPPKVNETKVEEDVKIPPKINEDVMEENVHVLTASEISFIFGVSVLILLAAVIIFTISLKYRSRNREYGFN